MPSSSSSSSAPLTTILFGRGFRGRGCWTLAYISALLPSITFAGFIFVFFDFANASTAAGFTAFASCSIARSAFFGAFALFFFLDDTLAFFIPPGLKFLLLLDFL
jgi:hypothetical protein